MGFPAKEWNSRMTDGERSQLAAVHRRERAYPRPERAEAKPSITPSPTATSAMRCCLNVSSSRKR